MKKLLLLSAILLINLFSFGQKNEIKKNQDSTKETQNFPEKESVPIPLPPNDLQWQDLSDIDSNNSLENDPQSKLLIQTNTGRSYTNTSVLENYHLPHYEIAAQLVDFRKDNDQNWKSIHYISIALNGLLFNQGAYSIKPETFAFTENNNGVTGLQQYQLPSISELLEYSKYSASIDINIFRYQREFPNENSWNLNFDVGYSIIATPLKLLPASTLVGKSLKDINGLINNLQGQIEDNTFPPSDNSDIKRQIGELVTLSDYLQVIPEERFLNNLGSLNNTANMAQTYFSASLKGQATIQPITLNVYAVLSLPINNLAATKSIYQLTSSSLDTTNFVNFSQLVDTLNLTKVAPDQINALRDQLTPIFTTGLRIDLKVSDYAGLFLQLQTANPWNTNGLMNSPLTSLTIGLRANVSPKKIRK